MHTNSDNAIVIIDSDDENEPVPTFKKRTPVIDVDAISIDLTDDDPPTDCHNITSPYTPFNSRAEANTIPAQNKPLSVPASRIILPHKRKPLTSPAPSSTTSNQREKSVLSAHLPSTTTTIPRNRTTVSTHPSTTVGLSRITPKAPMASTTNARTSMTPTPTSSTASITKTRTSITPTTQVKAPTPSKSYSSATIASTARAKTPTTSLPSTVTTSRPKTPIAPSPSSSVSASREKTSNLPTSSSSSSISRTKTSISLPESSTASKPIVSQNKVTAKTKAPVITNNRPIVIPQKWNSPSSLENRSSKAMLAKIASSTPERKLSVPRSKLLQNSTSTMKRGSSIIKAATTVRKPIPISTSLKRPIESPERPTHARRVFGSPERSSLQNNDVSVSHESSRTVLSRSPVIGSPDRRPSQTSPMMQVSPDRRTSQMSPMMHGSPERKPSQMFTAFGSPSDQRRPKASSSPFSTKQQAFKVTNAFYHLDDEDGSEKDLESFVSEIASTRKKAAVDNTPRAISMQCPVCYLMFPKIELIIHASECTGPSKEEEEVEGVRILGKKRGIRKNTIAAAVAMDESERKRLNKGKIDMGPTNYYADSEGALALDGTGFGAEATGMTWESAGTTTFS